jgi:sortase A
MAAGIVILVGTLGLYGYGQYEQWQISQEAMKIVPIAPTAAPPPRPTATVMPPSLSPTAGINIGISPSATAPPTETPRPVASTPTPDPTPVGPAPARRIVAPSIGLDTLVVEAPIVDGEWTVPKFVAGHLVGTAEPLQGGNVVLSGHVESISSGNVFANLEQMKPGDKIMVYTTDRIVTYAVHKTLVVKNDDMSVVQPQGRETLTLITCSGNWLPLKNDYDQRFVVVANLAS